MAKKVGIVSGFLGFILAVFWYQVVNQYGLSGFAYFATGIACPFCLGITVVGPVGRGDLILELLNGFLYGLAGFALCKLWILIDRRRKRII